MSTIKPRKRNLVKKLIRCFSEYKQIIIVKLDNVSTGQIQKARAALRESDGKGEMIVGKNTLILKALDWLTIAPEKNDRFYEDRKDLTLQPHLEVLKDYIKLNVGLVFYEGDYQKLREVIEAEVVEMQAKAGVYAPCDVTIPAGPTQIDAGKIDLFHKLNVPVKIARGVIEITKDFPIITKDEKVSEASALMCRTLNMTPFRYTLTFKNVMLTSGQIINEDIITMADDAIESFIKNGVRALTGLSLGISFPNKLSVPHMMVDGFKNLLALGMATGYEFKQLKEALTAGANASANAGNAGGEEKKEEEAPVEEEPEAQMSAGNLFGSDSDSSDEE